MAKRKETVEAPADLSTSKAEIKVKIGPEQSKVTEDTQINASVVGKMDNRLQRDLERTAQALTKVSDAVSEASTGLDQLENRNKAIKGITAGAIAQATISGYHAQLIDTIVSRTLSEGRASRKKLENLPQELRAIITGNEVITGIGKNQNRTLFPTKLRTEAFGMLEIAMKIEKDLASLAQLVGGAGYDPQIKKIASFLAERKITGVAGDPLFAAEQVKVALQGGKLFGGTGLGAQIRVAVADEIKRVFGRVFQALISTPLLASGPAARGKAAPTIAIGRTMGKPIQIAQFTREFRDLVRDVDVATDILGRGQVGTTGIPAKGKELVLVKAATVEDLRNALDLVKTAISTGLGQIYGTTISSSWSQLSDVGIKLPVGAGEATGVATSLVKALVTGPGTIENEIRQVTEVLNETKANLNKSTKVLLSLLPKGTSFKSYSMTAEGTSGIMKLLVDNETEIKKSLARKKGKLAEYDRAAAILVESRTKIPLLQEQLAELTTQKAGYVDLFGGKQAYEAIAPILAGHVEVAKRFSSPEQAIYEAQTKARLLSPIVSFLAQKIIPRLLYAGVDLPRATPLLDTAGKETGQVSIKPISEIAERVKATGLTLPGFVESQAEKVFVSEIQRIIDQKQRQRLDAIAAGNNPPEETINIGKGQLVKLLDYIKAFSYAPQLFSPGQEMQAAGVRPGGTLYAFLNAYANLARLPGIARQAGVAFQGTNIPPFNYEEIYNIDKLLGQIRLGLGATAFPSYLSGRSQPGTYTALPVRDVPKELQSVLDSETKVLSSLGATLAKENAKKKPSKKKLEQLRQQIASRKSTIAELQKQITEFVNYAGPSFPGLGYSGQVATVNSMQRVVFEDPIIKPMLSFVRTQRKLQEKALQKSAAKVLIDAPSTPDIGFIDSRSVGQAVGSLYAPDILSYYKTNIARRITPTSQGRQSNRIGAIYKEILGINLTITRMVKDITDAQVSLAKVSTIPTEGKRGSAIESKIANLTNLIGGLQRQLKDIKQSLFTRIASLRQEATITSGRLAPLVGGTGPEQVRILTSLTTTSIAAGSAAGKLPQGLAQKLLQSRTIFEVLATKVLPTLIVLGGLVSQLSSGELIGGVTALTAALPFFGTVGKTKAKAKVGPGRAEEIATAYLQYGPRSPIADPKLFVDTVAAIIQKYKPEEAVKPISPVVPAFALTRTSERINEGRITRSYDVIGQANQVVFRIGRASYDPATKQLVVEQVSGPGAGAVGARGIRETLRQLMAEFPNAQTIVGTRVTGVRRAATAEAATLKDLLTQGIVEVPLNRRLPPPSPVLPPAAKTLSERLRGLVSPISGKLGAAGMLGISPLLMGASGSLPMSLLGLGAAGLGAGALGYAGYKAYQHFTGGKQGADTETARLSSEELYEKTRAAEGKRSQAEADLAAKRDEIEKENRRIRDLEKLQARNPEEQKQLDDARKRVDLLKGEKNAIKDKVGSLALERQAYERVSATRLKHAKFLEGFMFGDNRRFRSFGTAVRTIFQYAGAAGIVYTIVGAVRDALQTGIQFEKTLADIQGILAAKLPMERLKIGEAIIDTAVKYGVAINEAAQAAKTFAQQGMPVSEIREMMEATFMGVRGAGMSVEQTKELLTAVRNITYNTKTQAPEVSSFEILDRISRVEARRAVTASDLADALKQAGPLAQQLSGSFVGIIDALDIVIGLTTTIVEQSRVTGKQAATSTRFMLSRLGAPQVIKNLQNIVPDLGLFDETGVRLRPLIEVLYELGSAYHRIQTEGGNVVRFLSTLAGARQINSASIILSNFGKTLDNIVLGSTAFGDTQARVALQMDTFAVKMEQFRNQYRKLGVEVVRDSVVFEGFKGALSGLNTYFEEGYSGLNKFKSGIFGILPGFEEAEKKILGLIAAVIGLVQMYKITGMFKAGKAAGVGGIEDASKLTSSLRSTPMGMISQFALMLGISRGLNPQQATDYLKELKVTPIAAKGGVQRQAATLITGVGGPLAPAGKPAAGVGRIVGGAGAALSWGFNAMFWISALVTVGQLLVPILKGIWNKLSKPSGIEEKALEPKFFTKEDFTPDKIPAFQEFKELAKNIGVSSEQELYTGIESAAQRLKSRVAEILRIPIKSFARTDFFESLGPKLYDLRNAGLDRNKIYLDFLEDVANSSPEVRKHVSDIEQMGDQYIVLSEKLKLAGELLRGFIKISEGVLTANLDLFQQAVLSSIDLFTSEYKQMIITGGFTDFKVSIPIDFMVYQQGEQVRDASNIVADIFGGKIQRDGIEIPFTIIPQLEGQQDTTKQFTGLLKTSLLQTIRSTGGISKIMESLDKTTSFTKMSAGIRSISKAFLLAADSAGYLSDELAKFAGKEISAPVLYASLNRAIRKIEADPDALKRFKDTLFEKLGKIFGEEEITVPFGIGGQRTSPMLDFLEIAVKYLKEYAIVADEAQQAANGLTRGTKNAAAILQLLGVGTRNLISEALAALTGWKDPLDLFLLKFYEFIRTNDLLADAARRVGFAYDATKEKLLGIIDLRKQLATLSIQYELPVLSAMEELRKLNAAETLRMTTGEIGTRVGAAQEGEQQGQDSGIKAFQESVTARREAIIQNLYIIENYFKKFKENKLTDLLLRFFPGGYANEITDQFVHIISGYKNLTAEARALIDEAFPKGKDPSKAFFEDPEKVKRLNDVFGELNNGVKAIDWTLEKVQERVGKLYAAELDLLGAIKTEVEATNALLDARKEISRSIVDSAAEIQSFGKDPFTSLLVRSQARQKTLNIELDFLSKQKKVKEAEIRELENNAARFQLSVGEEIAFMGRIEATQQAKQDLERLSNQAIINSYREEELDLINTIKTVELDYQQQILTNNEARLSGLREVLSSYETLTKTPFRALESLGTAFVDRQVDLFLSALLDPNKGLLSGIGKVIGEAGETNLLAGIELPIEDQIKFGHVEGISAAAPILYNAHLEGITAGANILRSVYAEAGMLPKTPTAPTAYGSTGIPSMDLALAGWGSGVIQVGEGDAKKKELEDKMRAAALAQTKKQIIYGAATILGSLGGAALGSQIGKSRSGAALGSSVGSAMGGMAALLPFAAANPLIGGALILGGGLLGGLFGGILGKEERPEPRALEVIARNTGESVRVLENMNKLMEASALSFNLPSSFVLPPYLPSVTAGGSANTVNVTVNTSSTNGLEIGQQVASVVAQELFSQYSNSGSYVRRI